MIKERGGYPLEETEEKLEEVASGPESHETDPANKLLLRKLREGNVSALVKVLLSDPNTKRRFYQFFNDKDILKTSGVDFSEPGQKVTPLIVSIMRDESLRELFVDAIHADFLEKTDLEKEDLKKVLPLLQEKKFESKEVQESAVFNRLILGAGVHGSIFANASTIENPDSKTLTVDASDQNSKNFSTKAFIKINSRNQAHQKTMPNWATKSGDLNYLGKRAQAQLGYIEPEAFPSADTFAELSAANLYLSSTEVLMKTKVSHIVSQMDEKDSANWPAENKVIFDDGTYVFAEEVYISTGLGEASFPKEFDEKSMEIVERDCEREDPNMPPGVMTVESFADFITRSDTPFRHFVNKKIDVAGGGDGGATVIEFFSRLASKKAYKLDVAQVGEVGKIDWVGQKMKDSKEYRMLLENMRYLLLAMEMPSSPTADLTEEQIERELSKKIQPIDGHIVQIRDSDDPKYRYKVSYLSKDEEGNTIIKENYTDFYIGASGYTINTGSILGYDKNPFSDPEFSEAVLADFPEEHKRLPIAVKLKGKKIFAMGPVSMGNVLFDAEAETTGVKVDRRSHPVNIATFGPRTEKLAQMAAQNKEKKLPKKSYEAAPFEVTRSLNEKSGGIVLSRRNSNEKLPVGGEFLDEVWVKTKIARLFEKAHAMDIDKLEIRASAIKEDKNAVKIEISPDINYGITERFDADLIDHLISFVQDSRWDIVIELPFFRGGTVDIPSMNIRKEPKKRI